MIYFVRSGQYIKIGISEAPRRRIASMQTGNPEEIEVLAIIEGGAALEAELHRRFAAFHRRGEWFQDDVAIRQAIADMPPLPPPQSYKRIAAPPRNAAPKEEPPALDNWRFEVKRKPRKATRRYAGSTAGDDWYYWVVRVNSDGRTHYYGTLDCLGPELNTKFRRHMMTAATPAPQEEPTP